MHALCRPREHGARRLDNNLRSAIAIEIAHRVDNGAEAARRGVWSCDARKLTERDRSATVHNDTTSTAIEFRITNQDIGRAVAVNVSHSNVAQR